MKSEQDANRQAWSKGAAVIFSLMGIVAFAIASFAPAFVPGMNPLHIYLSAIFFVLMAIYHRG